MSWFEILKFYIFYHSTTEEGLNAFNNGEPIKEGTFMSKIKEGARFRRRRPYRLKLQIPNIEYMSYWDWIDSVNRSKKWPGKYWDEWIVTTKPIIDYKILEVEDGWE